MENVVSIVNTRENPLEFDISVQGVDDKDAAVKFVIETNPVHFSFICDRNEDGKWAVTIPPLPHIEQVAYNFHLEIVVDGYYFEPYRGTLNVTAEPEVTAGGGQKVRPTVTAAPVVNSVEVKEDDKPIDDDEFQSLADKIINNHKKKEKVVEEKEPVKKADTAKDKAVKEAIEKFKNTPLEEGGGKKAYEMGLDDGKNSRPKKKAEKSFGGFAADYYKGYDEGKDMVDSEAWKEKTAAKRAGADYHESVEDKPKKPRKSNLSAAVQKLEEGPELSDQAKKVRDILNQ